MRPFSNVLSAEGWEELLLPETERQQRMGKVAFRGDADKLSVVRYNQ